MTLKIAFYIAEYGDTTDKLISFFTRSKYSHCELIFPNGEWASSSPRDGGVRFKFIEQDSHWDIFELAPWYTPEKQDLYEQFVRCWFQLNDDKTYDWIGAIGAYLNIDLSSENKKFCSQVCSGMIGLDNQNVTPGELYNTLIKMGKIKNG